MKQTCDSITLIWSDRTSYFCNWTLIKQTAPQMVIAAAGLNQ
jgi:hypothetical protein